MRVGIIAVLFLVVPAPAADDKPAVKEIATKELKITFPKGGNQAMPAEFKSADEVVKSEWLKDAADEIKKRVDFSTEKLVFFSWRGSGGDRVTPDEKTPGTFVFTRGKTKDLRSHIHLFAVPKDAVVKIVTAK